MADEGLRGAAAAPGLEMDNGEEEDEQEEEEERVTAHSYGALDASRASSDCWLIRLPPAIADVWDSVPEGTELGELVFCKGGGGGRNGTTTTTVAGAGAAANPKQQQQQQGGGGGGGSTSKPSITVHVNEHLLEIAKQQRGKASSTASGKAANTNSNNNTKHHKPLPGVLPLHYGLQAMTKKVPVLHPFSRNPASGSVKLWGVVSRTANLQVTQDQQYRALLKDRLVTSNVSGARYVKPVEASESIMSHNPAASATAATGTAARTAATAETSTAAAASSSSSSAAALAHPGNNPNLSSAAAEKKSFGNAISRIGKRLLEASEVASSSLSGPGGGAMAALPNAASHKRARQFSPDQPLRSVLFELFQVQERWAVKDLRMAAVAGGAALANAKRAEAEIRDILRDIGEYHRSGDYKNLWELKREFQTQHPQMQQQGQMGGGITSSQPGAGGAPSSSSSSSMA